MGNESAASLLVEKARRIGSLPKRKESCQAGFFAARESAQGLTQAAGQFGIKPQVISKPPRSAPRPQVMIPGGTSTVAEMLTAKS
jgi:hypothetical protein